MTMRLTDLQVRSAKSQAKDYRLSDGHGLYVPITKAGSKLWRWKYRFHNKEKLMSLGTYPEVSIVAAGDLHTNGRQPLAKDQDPLAEKELEVFTSSSSLQRSPNIEFTAPKNSCPWNIERPFRQTPSKQPRHSHQVTA